MSCIKMGQIILLVMSVFFNKSIYSQETKFDEVLNFRNLDILKLNLSEHPLLKRIDYEYINNNLEKFSEKIYEYNTDGYLRKTTENRFSHRFNEFTLFYVEEYIYYDLRPSLVEERISVRYADWDPPLYMKTLYYYNENDSLTQELIQGKLDSNSIWMNQFRFIYYYNEEGLIEQFQMETWKAENWVTVNMVNFIDYDSNKNLLESIQKDCSNGVCNDRYKNIWEYNSQNNNVRYLKQKMQVSSWEDYSQNLYEYDLKSNLVLNLFQYWNSGQSSWDNILKTEYSYDVDKNIVLVLSSRWDYYASTPDWIYSKRHTYKYQDGYKIEELNEAYDNEWKKQSKTVYYYEGITDVIRNPNNLTYFSLSQNYPNPFNPTTIIRYSIPSVERFAESLNSKNERIGNSLYYVTLKVYDILGKEVATLVNKEQPAGSYEVEFNSYGKEGLSSGVYFYRLQTGGFVKTNKMVLLK